MQKFVRNITGYFIALFCITCYSTSYAALLDVTSLSVNNASVNMTISGINADLSTNLVPPAEIIMGTYQDPITNYTTSFTGGTFEGTIYSSAGDGTLLAPSATVDTAEGNFSSIDLSSLRLSGTINQAFSTYSFDTELWPLTTPPSLTSYDALTGDFSLNWNFTTNFDLLAPDGSLTDTASTFDITISGQASVVPLPASVWLFSAGLFSLAGFLKHKRKRVI